MNPLIKGQVAQAQADAAKIFHDNPVVDFDSRKIQVGREATIEISAPGTFVDINVKVARPVEGPSLGQVKQGGSPVLPADSPQSWGKPNRR